MTWPDYNVTNDAQAQSVFQSASAANAITAIGTGNLSAIGQLQLAVANLLLGDSPISGTPAADVSSGTFGSSIPDTGTYGFPSLVEFVTALATPSALAATALNLFASTVSGGVVMGFGTTHDVALKNRAGTTALGVIANTTGVAAIGAFTVGNLLTVTAGGATITAGGLTVTAGNIGVGTAPSAAMGVQFTGAFASSATSLYGFRTTATTAATATVAGIGFYSGQTTAAAAHTQTDRIGFYHANVAKGAGSTITNDYAVYLEAPTQGGTLNRFLGSNLAGFFIEATGSFGTPSFIRSSGPTAGIGYSTGAGGAQTQATDKATTVVSNTITTAITMNNAALNAGVIVGFTFTNSAIAATDTVIVVHESAGTSGAYVCNAFPGAGSAVISVRNTTAGNLSEAIVLRVTVIKSVSA